MPNEYSSYANHPHYFAGSAPSLLALLFPFVVLALLFAVLSIASWGERRVKASRSKRMARAACPEVAAKTSSPTSAMLAPGVLASDAERDEVARRISHAVGEGRLSLEEGGHRIDAALCCRHRGELAALVDDLPLPSAPTVRSRLITVTPLRRVLLAVAAAVVLAAVLVQVVAGLWELWPLAVLALGAPALVTRARPLPAQT